ncbi:uncharacterized protein LOC117923613 isoform X2 [Vitis riparia]|uniref:uncharacterized protein LOC117923613 isoform X2 n=1 Tax=Vitis riparia TaxID=96939 RepID=UPI00155A988E|nr:uncharacterized protein LOC117923613 isoform X2 [Vitis riparia]
MKMAENPKLNSGLSTSNSSSEDCGMKEKETQKILVSDQVNGFQYKTEKSDSFVVDMEGFPNGVNKDTTANSRITLQRSLSRKGSQRGGEKKPNSVASIDADAVLATSSPRAALAGGSTLEKPVAVVVAAAAGGTTDHHPVGSQVHHHIAITAGNISTITESRCISRRYSFRRASPSWLIDPRRILFFFATLSSMGTILLIYFTLSIKRLGGDDAELDWQQ